MSLTTRLSLIDSLKHSGGTAAWERFYQTYSAVLLSFARRQGCDEHTAMDVLQETIMVIIRKLPGFEYDSARGRFRNWLVTIAANKSREAIRRSKLDRLISLEAPMDDAGKSLADMLPSEVGSASENVEQEWRQTLIEEALRQVLSDPRTKSENVEIFRAVALENQSVGEVAARYGIAENNVYQIKNRMMGRLQGIVAQMDSGSLEEIE